MSILTVRIVHVINDHDRIKLLFVLLGLVYSWTGFLLVGYILDRYVYSAGDFGCIQ